MKIRFKPRHQYDLETEAEAHELSKTTDMGEPMTKQSFKDDTDINVMMARMGVTDGSLPPVPFSTAEVVYDFTDTVDMREALDRINAANNHFNALPAKLRAEFNNDPLYMHQWLTNKDNHDRAVQLGLLHRETPAPKPEPMEVRVVNAAPDGDGK